MKDLRQTEEYSQYMELIGWNIEKIGSCFAYTKSLPLLGTVAKFQRPERADLLKIMEFIKEKKIRIFYFEPISALAFKNGFKLAKNCFLPAKTLEIDTTRALKGILKAMQPKTRYNVKTAKKNNIKVEASNDLESFIKLWHQSARSRGMWLSQKKEILSLSSAFDRKSHLLLAKKDNELLAGVFLIQSQETLHYMFAASTKRGKALFAPTLLVWEAIRLAKQLNLKIFDFEGIYDNRYPETANWKGFTKFKEGFGGKEKTYPKTLVRFSPKFLGLFSIL